MMGTPEFVCAIAVLVLLVGDASGRAWLTWIAKPAASLSFVAAAWVRDPVEPFAWTLVAGLGLCLVGDVCLLSRARLAFLAGLSAFFAGHVAYTIAFAQRGLDPLLALGSGAALLVPANFVWRWLAPHVEPAMRPPVLAYVAAITTMVACAIATGHALTIVGAVGFYLSDLSVARDVFVRQALANRLWGLPLYYSAQLCLAHTV